MTLCFTNLNRWTGTPLDQSNLQAFLEPKTHLLSIAPSDDYVAQLVIEQEQRGDLHVDEEIELKFEHLPHETYLATVTEVADRHWKLPNTLEQRESPIPTETDAQNERLQNTSYLARVSLTEDVDLLKLDCWGQARFLVDERTAGQWLWKYIRRTFHFHCRHPGKLKINRSFNFRFRFEIYFLLITLLLKVASNVYIR
ncbi:MAG: hypothetical protein R3C11_05615 [Planctomycetaceae bacterium]